MFSLSSIYLIPVYPLIAFFIIVLGLAFKFLPKRLGSLIVITSTLLSLIHTFSAMFQWMPSGKVYEIAIPWLKAGDLVFSLGQILDWPAIVMLIVVTTVSLLIHIYTHGYMNEDPNYNRFLRLSSAI